MSYSVVVGRGWPPSPMSLATKNSANDPRVISWSTSENAHFQKSSIFAPPSASAYGTPATCSFSSPFRMRGWVAKAITPYSTTIVPNDRPGSGGAGRNAAAALLQVVLQLLAARGVAQLPQRLRLYLADALPRHVELPPNLFQRAAPAVLQPEAQHQHLLLARRQRAEHVLHVLLEKLVRGRLRRRHRPLVLDEVAQVGVLLLTDRRLQRHGLLRDLYDLAHLVRRDLHPAADLLAGRLAPVLLHQPAADADQLVYRLHHVDGDADGARLVGDGAGDRLADPPGGVGAELVALAVVELLHRADEADVPLLDEVQERHAATDVLLGDADDEAQVGLRQPLFGPEPLFLEPLEVRLDRLFLCAELIRQPLRRGQQVLLSCRSLRRHRKQLRRQDVRDDGYLDQLMRRCPLVP